jgi:ABC-type Na+ transport system ATPase subunit NatA
MGKETNELLALIAGVDSMYWKTEDREEREKLLTYHRELSVRLEELAKKQFKAGDRAYLKLMNNLRAVNRQVGKFMSGQKKVVDIFTYLVNITEQLDAVLFGFKKEGQQFAGR